MPRVPRTEQATSSGGGNVVLVIAADDAAGFAARTAMTSLRETFGKGCPALGAGIERAAGQRPPVAPDPAGAVEDQAELDLELGLLARS